LTDSDGLEPVGSEEGGTDGATMVGRDVQDVLN
jgi:hypothetical protein